jgi:hypothetical protein
MLVNIQTLHSVLAASCSAASAADSTGQGRVAPPYSLALPEWATKHSIGVANRFQGFQVQLSMSCEAAGGSAGFRRQLLSLVRDKVTHADTRHAHVCG